MFSVMTWNLENFERPAANAEQATKDRYARKLQQISELITSAGPDLVGVQEILANPKNLTPPAFEDLRAALGAEWTGCLSQRPDPRGIRVGWLARGQLANPTDVAVYPNRYRPSPSTTTTTRSRRSPPPSAERWPSPTPAVTAWWCTPSPLT
jgi:hypothetical protein